MLRSIKFSTIKVTVREFIECFSEVVVAMGAASDVANNREFVESVLNRRKSVSE